MIAHIYLYGSTAVFLITTWGGLAFAAVQQDRQRRVVSSQSPGREPVGELIVAEVV